MSDQRFIIEMGMGNSQYDMDYTKAARRAIQDAVRHSSIPLFQTLEIDTSDMRVQVTVGVQAPEQVDCEALADEMPRGRATVTAVFGGMNVQSADPARPVVVATAAVEAFLPNLSGRYS